MRLFTRHINLGLAALALLAAAAFAQQAAEKPKILEGLPAGAYAWFKTNQGEFAAKLFTDLAPITTANFIGLTGGTKAFIDPKSGAIVKRPFYDGLIFHRVMPGFMLQGGDPEGTGYGGPGYRFKDEFAPTLRFTKPGLLAMANSGPNTNGSQFFVTVTPESPDKYPTHLNDKHTIFGEVVKGQDVVEKIAKVKTGPQDRPVSPVVMEKVRIFKIDAAPAADNAKTSPTQAK